MGLSIVISIKAMLIMFNTNFIGVYSLFRKSLDLLASQLLKKLTNLCQRMGLQYTIQPALSQQVDQLGELHHTPLNLLVNLMLRNMLINKFNRI